MRIAIIVPALNEQAPILIAVNLAAQFSKRGHSVTIFYFDKNVSVMVSDGVKIQRLGFWQRINWSDFDVIHSHLFRADAYVFLHKPFLRPSSARVFSTAHNYVYSELKNYYNLLVCIVFGFLWNIFWLRFDLLCVLSQHAKEYYKRTSFNKKIVVCFNGRDLNIDYSLIPADVDQLCRRFSEQFPAVIGSYCNLIKRKRIDRLVKYVSTKKDVGLMVIGSGPEEVALRSAVRGLGIEGRVLFLGYQPNANLFNKYFDVYAIPSESEGFGLALIEAALHAKKIICSDIPVFREMFDEHEVTFFDASEASLCEAIDIAILDNSKPAKAMLKALTKFSVTKMTDTYLNLYR